MSASKTCIARITSNAPSAIAVVQIWGPQALEIVQQCWTPHRGHNELRLNQIRYGTVCCEGNAQGESVVVCRTSSDAVEIHCHGGRMAASQLIQHCVILGAIETQARESIQSDKLGLIELEALEDLTKATTTTTTAILMDQWRGALSKEFQDISLLLADKQSLPQAREKLLALRERIDFGSHLIQPWRIVLAGPPNVGKSSLLNRLLGYKRAIVHEQAGTTRDLLTEQTSIEGWPMEIIDGAGIRSQQEVADDIEATGVERTLQRIGTADCVLLLIDSSVGWTRVHDQLVDAISCRKIFVHTKADLLTIANGDRLQSSGVQGLAPNLEKSKVSTLNVATSCLSGFGLQELMQAMVDVLIPQKPISGMAVPFRHWHGQWVTDSLVKTGV